MHRVGLGLLVLLQFEEADPSPVVLHGLLAQGPAVLARQGERLQFAGAGMLVPLVPIVVEQGGRLVGPHPVRTVFPFQLHDPEIHADLDQRPAMATVDPAHSQLAGFIFPGFEDATDVVSHTR